MRSLYKYLLVCLLSWSLVACHSQLKTSPVSQEQSAIRTIVQGKITEVSPPNVIQQLRATIDSSYQPQVTILSPQKEEILEENNVNVQIEVKDYKIFQEAELGLGPHLELIVDNQPKQAIYSTKEPIILENLTPGTHTLRVFAVTPWGESLKNEGAYTETTFHLYSKTNENSPVPNQPILTYNQPQGNYGAEPILLDFYLANAPLHVIADENKEDNIEDWRIKVTINSESFYLDRWEPIYLKGFNQGKNWVQIEYINEKGLSVNNAFNNTVRVITYQPDNNDSLAKLMQDQLPLDLARTIIDPDYQKPTLKLQEEANQTEPFPEEKNLEPLDLPKETPEEAEIKPTQPEEAKKEPTQPEEAKKEPTQPEETPKEAKKKPTFFFFSMLKK